MRGDASSLRRLRRRLALMSNDSKKRIGFHDEKPITTRGLLGLWRFPVELAGNLKPEVTRALPT